MEYSIKFNKVMSRDSIDYIEGSQVKFPNIIVFLSLKIYFVQIWYFKYTYSGSLYSRTADLFIDSYIWLDPGTRISMKTFNHLLPLKQGQN